MYARRPRRIVFATDGSPGADGALELLCALPFAHEDRVDVVAVPVPLALPLETGFGDLSIAYDAAAETTARSAERLRQCGIQAECRVAEGPLVEAIIGSARAVAADLIVVGSRGLGLILGTLLGSTARALVHASPFPVLVVRDRRAAPQRVLLAVDGSPDSQAAVNALCAVPLARPAEIVVVHVVPDARKETTRPLDLLCLVAAKLPPTFTTHVEVARGDVAGTILARAAALGSDLIALGSGGTHSAPLQATIADRILSAAHCSVLVARAAQRVKTPEPVTRKAPVATPA